MCLCVFSKKPSHYRVARVFRYSASRSFIGYAANIFLSITSDLYKGLLKSKVIILMKLKFPIFISQVIIFVFSLGNFCLMQGFKYIFSYFSGSFTHSGVSFRLLVNFELASTFKILWRIPHEAAVQSL